MLQNHLLNKTSAQVDAVAVVVDVVDVALVKVKLAWPWIKRQCNQKTPSRPLMQRMTRSWPTRLPKPCLMGVMRKWVAMSHAVVVAAVVVVATVMGQPVTTQALSNLQKPLKKPLKNLLSRLQQQA